MFRVENDIATNDYISIYLLNMLRLIMMIKTDNIQSTELTDI